MFSLVPELEPTMSDHFIDYDSELTLGTLYYDNYIGRVVLNGFVELKENLSLLRRYSHQPKLKHS